jgi:hypothetical protein
MTVRFAIYDEAQRHVWLTLSCYFPVLLSG